MDVYTTDFSRKSWVEVDASSDFHLQNIPFGIFKTKRGYAACSAIGNYIIDLSKLHDMGCLGGEICSVFFNQRYLNEFIALGRITTNMTRMAIMHAMDEADPYEIKKEKDSFLYPIDSVEMLVPIQIGDYTDFYSSKEHATNVGIMFRDPANALLPNWLHIPVGYHGRASSIVASKVDIKRPKGQQSLKDGDPPVFGPTRQLDFELEMAFVVGKSNELGTPIDITKAEDYIFGLMLFNDWSARDIQKWEYVPLGPFLGKNFGSTVSPWIVTLEALEPFRTAGPIQSPEVLPYLKQSPNNNFDIDLEVYIQTKEGISTKVSHSNFKHMYWSMVQQLTHHTVNGCNMRVGDLCASGTISGPTPDSYGSMLELAWKGTKPIELNDGTLRSFIQDEDTVTMKGYGVHNDVRIGFGECTATISPA